MEAPRDHRDPVDELRRELAAIKERNVRVEREKAWETSWTRRLAIAAAIWVGAWAWMLTLDVEPAALHALVPSVAYVLSTFSVPFVREWWMRRNAR